MYQGYTLEVAVLIVFGQMIDLQKENSDLLNAINSLNRLSRKKYLYLRYPATEMFVESKRHYYTFLKIQIIIAMTCFRSGTMVINFSEMVGSWAISTRHESI